MNVFDASELSAGELLTALMANEIALPCWIKVGNSKHKVTPENKRGVEIGLQLALDIKFKPRATER